MWISIKLIQSLSTFNLYLFCLSSIINPIIYIQFFLVFHFVCVFISILSCLYFLLNHLSLCSNISITVSVFLYLPSPPLPFHFPHSFPDNQFHSHTFMFLPICRSYLYFFCILILSQVSVFIIITFVSFSLLSTVSQASFSYFSNLWNLLVFLLLSSSVYSNVSVLSVFLIFLHRFGLFLLL